MAPFLSGGIGGICRQNEFDVPVVLPDTDARIRGAEVDPDSGAVNLSHVTFECEVRGVE